MNKRPHSVTVICWIFIVIGAGALLASSLPPSDAAAAQSIASYKAQHPFEWALFFVGPVLALICGILMLFGFGWARWLLHAWFGHNILVNVVLRPRQFVPGAILFGLAVYYLYRSQAAAFFQASKAKRAAKVAT
jgi:hypothetical protein